MKSSVIRKILGGLSLTSAMFIFQACYGTPGGFPDDVLIEGQVKAKTTGLPVAGIKISVSDSMQYEYTDANGNFSFYTYLSDKINLEFSDVDSTQNGLFIKKDTVLTNVSDDIHLEIMLEESK